MLSPALLGALLLSATSTPTASLLELRAGGTLRGEVAVLVGDGVVWISADDLEQADIRVDRIDRRTIDGRDFVTSASLGRRASFDLVALSMELDVDPARLESTTIDLERNGPDGMIRASDASLFLNVAPRLVDGTEADAFAEVGVSAFGSLLIGRGGVDATGRAYRTDTQLLVDDRANLTRWTVGDAFAASGALGGAATLGGISYGRAFDLDPYAVHTPTLDLQGQVATPSTVEVWLDGSRISSTEIPAGTYQLANVVPPARSGDAQVVVRDAFGRQQVIETSYYGTASGLARGESDFGYTLGFVRENIASASFDYGAPVLVGRHRFGLGSGVTLGGRLEAAQTYASGGPSLSLSTGLGQIDLALAASASSGPDTTLAGYAGRLTYAWRHRRVGVGVELALASAHYANLSLAPTVDRMLESATVHAGTSIAGINLAVGGMVGEDRDRGLVARASGSARLPIAGDLQLGASISGASDGVVRGELSLSMMLPGRVSAVVAGRSSESIAGTVSRPMGGREGIGFRASSTVDRAHVIAGATVEGAARFGRAEVDVATADGDFHGSVALGFAIVAIAGGGVHLSRPVEQSFAVVEVPGAANVRAYLDNREIGTTDGRGRVFVPDLLPYYGNRLRIDDSDLGLDYGLVRSELTIAPPLRGGAIVQFDARRQRWLRGVLANAAGWSSGTLRIASPDGVLESPIGSAGELELVDLGPGTWSGEAEARDGRRCVVELVVPDGDEPMVELGALTCREVAR